MPTASITVPACLLLCLALGCQRGKEQAVVIEPSAVRAYDQANPVDPFGAGSRRLRRLARRDRLSARIESGAERSTTLRLGSMRKPT